MAGHFRASGSKSLRKNIVVYKNRVRSGKRIHLNAATDNPHPETAGNFLEIWETVILP
jgi:hypothetical protein